MDKNVQTFIGCENDYNNADIVMFGAPFDSTTSYRPGTRFASSTIRTESYGLETYSPYCERDLADTKIFDGGDLELPFGNPEPALEIIEKFTEEILADKKIPCMIGGEHLVTLGAVRAAAKRYPDLHIVQFDAHADLRDDYLGQELSHACIMKRCYDILGDGKIYQFGIRSGTREEFEFAKKHTHMHKFDLENLHSALKKMGDTPIYFTLDLDVLDPGIFPGTGTPEAGGISFRKLIRGCSAVFKHNIVGFDVTELAPIYDQSGVSTATACKILRELLLLGKSSRQGKGNA